MQVVCGHQVHVLSQHVHPVGQFTHDLVGELAGEQLQGLLQLRRPVGEVLEETIPDGELLEVEIGKASCRERV